jgi:hypothetical protein
VDVSSAGPLNNLPSAPPEKDGSGGHLGDLLEAELAAALSKPGDRPTTAREAQVMTGAVAHAGRGWSELLLDGRPAFETLPEVRPLPPLEFTIELDHMPSCSGWTFDYGGPFDCPGVADVEPDEAPVLLAVEVVVE